MVNASGPTSSGHPTLPVAASDRKERLYDFLQIKERQFRVYAARNHLAFGIMFWTGIVVGLVASFIGVFAGKNSWITPATVSGFAAVATGFQVAARQGRLNEKANWHDRRSDRIGQLLRNLRFQINDPPTQEEINFLVQSYNDLEDIMTAELLDFTLDTSGGKRPSRPKKVVTERPKGDSALRTSAPLP